MTEKEENRKADDKLYALAVQDGVWPNDNRGSIICSLKANSDLDAINKMQKLLTD